MQRILDVFLALLALVVLAPLLLPIAIILRLSGEGEIFYKQPRVGYKAELFDIWKFATMLKNSPNLGTGLVTVQGDPRILPIGGFLRKTKINELPQLINVLKGDMSLIGPRPLAPRGFNAYTVEVKKIVTQVPPGLSGIGSIALRNEEEILHIEGDQGQYYDTVVMPYKGALECWYVEHKGLGLYLTLIGLTVITVMFPKARILERLFPSLPRPSAQLAQKL
jgi:lipopolysaccharide/colanic/teichoic acid biosynthesis glycosyltransferase